MFKVVWYQERLDKKGCWHMLEKEYNSLDNAVEFFTFLTTCDDVKGLKLKHTGGKNE